ncbi:unnamed protein product [Bemisia tabaci]|uniref:Fatty acid desaturase domain-containing protein n=1 Tax=Bemisia tabaci TaxID=7038 RepID=A0A9P0A0X4_BEMTA|nr:PREDICTED: acyl-CoA desaturase-like [Bemisia tabaci]CAH0381718.1 unnamed protein product [Bemisia tabaci]
MASESEYLSAEVLNADDNHNESKKKLDYTPKLKWPDLIAQIFIHGGALYGLYLTMTAAKIATTLWALGMIYLSGFGITAGVHRLWSHRAYKAKWPLRLLLAFLFTISGQRHIYAWALDHRVHHKYSESDSDPHDARRGFWFAHVGWLFLTPHPSVEARRKAIDMTDLENDPIVYWQREMYIPLFALLCIGLPVFVPWYYFDESLWISFFVCFNLRFSATLNLAFSVNSFAHMYGFKPYDKNIMPTENIFVSLTALGEGWHNYHHVFPQDYKTGEFGTYGMNFTTAFIDAFAYLGQAYDLKAVDPALIKKRAARSGDVSCKVSTE